MSTAARTAANPAKPAGKRIRRTAEEARRLILDAAEKRLAQQGPEGLRLQDIARDIGISHPAILHHFESREGLVRALIARANTQLRDTMLTALGGGHASSDATDHIGHVFEALSDRGTARLLSWLLLTGRATENSTTHNIMGEIVDALQLRRAEYAEKAGKPTPDKEDTLFMAMLTANAAFGEAIVGRQLAEAVGLDQDGIKRFRNWFAKLLNEHWDGGK
ncbi:MAG: helix-turn-helix domain-containing protein [Parvibaculum sp.]|uniref:TetR/AcrR family transcriptional regulator n=1 Tax=Parvibaculum sp. TaxID=2024848 RepID=UPI002728EAC1|nr:TetR/AcrR family transcriptional regulator [Parvibaculum sp.]MDO8837931.1 helix-turn-helix domain-containing protein [Parvibaculum sp.]